MYFLLCRYMLLGTGFLTFAFCSCYFCNKQKVWYPCFFTFNFGENYVSQTFPFFELTFFQCWISFIPEMLKCLVCFLCRIKISISENFGNFSPMIPAMPLIFRIGKVYFPTFRGYYLTMLCTLH